jgi:serine/threonine-protein kinase
LTPAQTDEFIRFTNALAGQYELEREIGRGGMGIVYLARDLKLDRHVAIKTLPPHLSGDPIVRERFIREARMAGGLSHPNIVAIHRADEIDGQVFFVMGYVNGESLAQRIRERGRIDAREVVHELRDVASALGYAHSRGVIHRDVKAENILIDAESGRALVTDFGIARLAESTPLTATGQVLGTVYYLSPEQVSGERVDARSDIYSLGVVGYFALSGRFPFDAALASAVLIAHVTKTPSPLHEISGDTPRALTDIIDRCLAKDPDERFQTCDALITALSEVENLVAAEMRERATSGEPVAQPGLLSDSEAHAIWRRAADLQALTGVQPRSTPVVGSRDLERDAVRTSGYPIGDVRDAALEAGISSKYVDHAFAEHGLPVVPSDSPPPLTDRSKPPAPIVGASSQIDYETVIEGEMPENDYDLLVDVIRHVTGDSGLIGTVGRSFSWQTAQSVQSRRRNLQVSVLPRGGKTTIRVSENLSGAVGGLFGGIIGGFGGGTTGIWIGIGVNFHSAALAVGLCLGSIGVAYTAARTIFGVVSRRRRRLLRSLTEALAAQARDSIAAENPKLSAASTRRLRG